MLQIFAARRSALCDLVVGTNTVSFASQSDPTITNLPYDEQGNLVRENGFGTISGVRPPRTIQLVTRLTF